MINQLKEWDEELFLFLNSLNTDWLDPIMLTLTGRYIWIPLYLWLIYLVIRTFGKQGLWYILGMLIVILLADQFTSAFMKPYFGRLRPCHDERWQEVIFNFSGCGGLYGFASAHAANTFALAAYLNFTAAKKIPGFKWLFLWAAIISYTRIYLGVHYPLDVLIGAMVGVIAAWLTWWLISYLIMVQKRKRKPSDQ